jgi:parallel beta-helix repeat protein
MCLPGVALAASWTVSPGQSIQAAVDAAAPGDIVKVLPGDYVETHGDSAAVRVTKKLKLIAKSNPPLSRVRILPGPGNSDGIVVEPENPGDPNVDGILIKGFTVEGFQNNGIWLKYVENFKIKNNESFDNEENGIWPTLSANGLVKKNVSYGSLDAALWVEASENVRVIGNELAHAPTGLEVTISNNVVMKGNDIHDNTVGVGLYHPSAAGLPFGGLEDDWTLIGNTIRNNNDPNSAPPGSLSAELPSGVGILLLGVDENRIERNTIQGNNLTGIAVIDWCFANDCGSNPPEVTDTVPDDNLIANNTLNANGLAASGPYAFLASSIVLLPGSGTNNCFSNNSIVGAGTLPGTLPGC